MTLTEIVKSLIKKPVVYITTALLAASCYTMPNTRDEDVRYQNAEPIESVNEKDEYKTFIGRPASIEHKGNDLNFVMTSYDGNKLYRVAVYEEADNSNVDNINMVEDWVVQSLNDPSMELKVIGPYDRTFSKGDNYEEGTIDPTVIIKMTSDDSTEAFEEAVWTNGKDSEIYTDKHIDIIFGYVYPPGHHFGRRIHYPYSLQGFYPFWDIDGDGIPNEWDPWPTVYGPWVDNNHNHVWDWYDPFIGGPYWDHWDKHFGHHHEFYNNWKDHYKHDFKTHKDFTNRNRDAQDIRNNMGGRNPGRDPRTLPNVIKDGKKDKLPREDVDTGRDPKKGRNLEDRTDQEKEIIKGRDKGDKDKTIERKVKTIPPVNTDDEKKKSGKGAYERKREYDNNIERQKRENEQKEQLNRKKQETYQQRNNEVEKYNREKNRTYQPPNNNYNTRKENTRTDVRTQTRNNPNTNTQRSNPNTNTQKQTSKDNSRRNK